MTFADTSSHIPGYKFVGRTKDDLWGKWVKDDGHAWTNQEHQQWRQERKRLWEQFAQNEQQKYAIALSAEERDPLYRKLLNQLSLHHLDREDLLKRGLTDEQIKACGVKSVEQWQKLDSPLSHTLPGVNLTGDRLNTPAAGYLWPIRNVEGQIVGSQERFRDARNGWRHCWVTSATKSRPHGPSPHLPNGELPLAVHRPLEIKRNAIALVEGVGAKPFILSQRLGIITIGAAGGQFASSRKTLRHTLSVLSAELNTRVIEFHPDAGAVFNRQVLRQYRATWKLLYQWGYEVRVAWWGQKAKDAPDIDELVDYSQIQWITTAQFEAIAHPHFAWLTQIKRKLQRPQNSLRSASALRQALGDSEVVSYQPGERLTTWAQGINQGHRYILDTSPPGSGKSFDAGNIDPCQIADHLHQVIYISDQHRNPSVETLSITNGWVDLEARHAGLITEKTPNGSDRLRRAKLGQVPSHPANCARTGLIGTLRTKQIQGADTAAVVCGTCHLREACIHAEGPGYGFLNQRHSALSSPQLRSHPDSLPAPLEYDYASTISIWDEPGQSFQVKRDIVITRADLEQTIVALVTYPDLLQQVQPLIAELLPYLDGQIKLPKFGQNHSQVLALLPDVDQVSISALEKALQPNLSFLDTTTQYGVASADLPPSLRKKFTFKDEELASQAEQTLIKQWLPDLLRVLTGKTQGALRLHQRLLTLSLLDTRHRAIAQASSAIIFLDATLSREDLALKLGCDPREIYLCYQVTPLIDNLRLLQVTDTGRMGMQRGKDQQRRTAAILNYYQTKDSKIQVIDFKRFANQNMGAWWRDSRGVNDFEEITTLILVGTPCRNLGDLLAEYGILSGCHHLEDPGFKAFVDRAIRADMYQAIGRLRAHRRSNEMLQVIILSDFDLQLTNVELTKASAITLEAANKFETFTLAIEQAVQQLQADGKKVTQSAIAALTDYSQQYISRYWKLLQTLLEVFNSKGSKKFEAQPNEIAVIMEEAIQACQDTPQLLTTIGEVFLGWVTPRQWQRLWHQLSQQAQLKILTALLLTLPSNELTELYRGYGYARH
ncbi:hypothetical protein [Trichocoleus sp. FACHB-46]|uniref:DUF3854 domain-containing protein n=2 Tax=Trichocoleus TaxID=450526 RepID=A0ABV0JFM7_9CYAN|nr:hypothetical protein [Trichocoleus sp. FACHB-46]MBD1864883.1 hypothetical protein [Trichocoleus sp. FACHB-46]